MTTLDRGKRTESIGTLTAAEMARVAAGLKSAMFLE
ncbi:MAG: hypothetical protein IT186_19525 [Acidobacteria bacterium]|nr:hypothetical protein [Acidobacteriota bacterium]